MIRIATISIFLLFLSLPSWGQQDLDYGHKSISKTLKKLGVGKGMTLLEFPHPDQLANNPFPNGKYFKISKGHESDKAAYLFVGRVNTCRSGGCVVHYGDSEGINFEYFDFFMVFDKNADVSMVKVFKYEATHGHEITAKRWLKQFRSYDGNQDLQVGKDIDGISGATTSVYSITYEIQERTKRLKAAMTLALDSK